jgi:hypothetical protein
MMSKLDEYAILSEKRKEKFEECIRKSGPLSIGPTNRGGIWLKINNKDILTDISIKELENIAELIKDFLAVVAS